MTATELGLFLHVLSHRPPISEIITSERPSNEAPDNLIENLTHQTLTHVPLGGCECIPQLGPTHGACVPGMGCMGTLQPLVTRHCYHDPWVHIPWLVDT